MPEILKYQFIQNALLACIMASIVCGIIGVIIVEKKLVMMTGGIAHTSYGGVGLGYLLGFEPLIGAFVISIAASLCVASIKRKKATRSDIIIGLLWSVGMALGILFIAMMPGYPPDLSSYLFGNILSVTRSDIYLIAALTVIVVLVVAALFNYWKAYAFDEEFAVITGIKTIFLEYLLFILIAMSIVVLIRVVGIILAMALFTAPTASAGLLSGDFKKRMCYAVLLGAFFCLTGLWMSYAMNVASGAFIVIISAAGYMLIHVFKSVYSKRNIIQNKSHFSK